jgi:hypothetical protein
MNAKNPSEIDPPHSGSYFSQAFKDFTTVVLLGGFTCYAVLHSAYAEFYGRLGITPADVGYGYAVLLSNAVGSIVYYFGQAVVVLGIAWLLLAWATPLARRIVLALIAIFIIGYLGHIWITDARESAQDIINGESVIPSHFGLLRLSSYQAYPVQVSPVDKTTGAIGDLEKKSLLYLGQANGYSVLYNSSDKEVEFIPHPQFG